MGRAIRSKSGHAQPSGFSLLSLSHNRLYLEQFFMTTTSIKIAYHISTGKTIHIKEAQNGSKCECKCPDPNCNEKLDAIQGPEREWHFRHQGGKDCLGAQETALHQLAKQILTENTTIDLPKHGTITYSDAIAEKEFLSIRPDVTAVFNGEKIYFEIAVKHFIENNKEVFLTNGQHKCVEIDLSKADPNSYDKIKDLVIKEVSNKKLIGWEPKKFPQNGFHPAVKWIVGGALLLGAWLWSRNDD